MAEDLVRTRNYIARFIEMKTQLSAVGLKIQAIKSHEAMSQAMTVSSVYLYMMLLLLLLLLRDEIWYMIIITMTNYSRICICIDLTYIMLLLCGWHYCY